MLLFIKSRLLFWIIFSSKIYPDPFKAVLSPYIISIATQGLLSAGIQRRECTKRLIGIAEIVVNATSLDEKSSEW